MPQEQGVFHPCPGKSCSPESEACLLFSKLIRFIFNLNARPARQLAHRAPLHGNHQPRMLDLARDVMQLHVYLVLHGRNHPAGIYSLLPDSDHTCSHDVTRALKNKKPLKTVRPDCKALTQILFMVITGKQHTKLQTCICSHS